MISIYLQLDLGTFNLVLGFVFNFVQYIGPTSVACLYDT